jgi:hypothetical protein
VNIGLHEGISDEKHRLQMGPAIWLYLWLVRRQTRPNGMVLGGSPITYDMIHEQTGHPVRSLQRWMSILADLPDQKFAYIELSYLSFKQMRLRVLKPKKFGFRQIPLPMEEIAGGPAASAQPSAKSGGSFTSKVADIHAKSGGFKQSGSLRNSESERESGFEPPVDWIPFGPWRGYVRMRERIGRPLTEYSIGQAILFLSALRAQGNDPAEVLEQSIWSSSVKFWPVSKNGGANGSDSRNRRPSGAIAASAGKYDKRKVVELPNEPCELEKRAIAGR